MHFLTADRIPYTDNGYCFMQDHAIKFYILFSRPVSVAVIDSLLHPFLG